MANQLFLGIWQKKVWRINRSNRLLTVSTNLDGFSLANYGQFAKYAKLSCYTVFGRAFFTPKVFLREINITCNGNTGTRALPDMSALALGHCAPLGIVRTYHIRQCTSACVATNMLHFRYSKNLPKLIINRSAYLYGKG